MTYTRLFRLKKNYSEGKRRQSPVVRTIYHIRSASHIIRHRSVFASLTNTRSIRSTTENTVIKNNGVFHPVSGKLSRLTVAAIYRKQFSYPAKFDNVGDQTETNAADTTRDRLRKTQRHFNTSTYKASIITTTNINKHYKLEYRPQSVMLNGVP